MEVLGAGDQVGDVSRQYKRRADDFRRAARTLARFHLDGLDRRIALRIQRDVPTQGPAAAGGGDRAAGDYSAIKAGAIDPITPCIGLCVGAGAGECTAGGFDGTPGDDNVVIQPIPAIDAAAHGAVAAGRDSAAGGVHSAAGNGDNISVDAAAGITSVTSFRNTAAGGFDGAAGDGDVVSGVNAMALKLCRPAGGGDGTASDDGITPGVNAVASPTAVLGGIAAGSGQAAAAGDGEDNLTINIDAVAIYKISRSARPGDGVVFLQDDFQVSCFVVVDGGTLG